MKGSRVQFFEHNLAILQYEMAFKALLLVKEEMCIEKGFSRHNGTHYYFHLVDVAQKLLNAGVREEDIITAALLHDLVEDVTDTKGKPVYSINDITILFNDNVATMVDLLTKKPWVDYKKDKNELQRYLDEISKNYGASLIKCADRQNNFGSLLEASSEKRIRTALETEEYYLPFFKKCRKLYPWYASFFFDAKTTIEPHLWAIKESNSEIQRLKKQITLLKKQIEKK
jgi:guanosine-3',5'-bis(diphosphate) 3'-pyrophosphohydrolase